MIHLPRLRLQLIRIRRCFLSFRLDGWYFWLALVVLPVLIFETLNKVGISQLFSALDTEETGYLDRHRMLHLLEKFYDKMENGFKGQVNNPRKCKPSI